MTKNTSQCYRTQQFVFPVEEEVRFTKERKLSLFFVDMGNCQSRPSCCTADNPETTPPKTARSEKSANLEMNSHHPTPGRFFPYSGSDRFNKINGRYEKERAGWREVQSMTAEKAEEARITHGLESIANNVGDANSNLSSNAARKEAQEYKETSSKPEKVDEETRKEFLRQLHQTSWKDVNQRIMKAREVALARKENDVNQGATTSAESPSCSVPSSDEWLIHHPCLFDAIDCSEDASDDEGNCSQSPATGHAAISIKLKIFFKKEEHEEPSEEPEFESISPMKELHAEIDENKSEEGSALNSSILFVSTDQPFATEGDNHLTESNGPFSPGLSPCPSPRPGALTRILKRRRNNSVEDLVSRSGSEAEETVPPPAMTPTPSPENRPDSRGGFLRGVISRMAKKRSNRVHDVTSPGKSQSSSNSAIHSNPKSSSDRALQTTPQTSNRNSLTRAWLNILGRRSPPTSGRVTQILVRPYDESQAENGRRLVPSPASVEQKSMVEVSSPLSRVQSYTSDIATFEIEDDIEVCSFTSSPTFDVRPAADLGGGT